MSPPPARTPGRAGPLAAVAAVAALALVAGDVPAPDEPVQPPPAAVADAGSAQTDEVTRTDTPPARRDAPRRANRTAVLPPTHTVRPGDTLGSVAQRYGVTPAALADANAVDRSALLHPGDTLVVPRPDVLPLTTPEKAAAAGQAVDVLFAEAAARFGLDLPLVRAVAWRESRWTQRVVSHRGAIGIMQVQPATGEAMARHVGRPLDLHDVRDNVVAGTAYLAYRLDRRGGDLRAALADYHQGSGSVQRGGRIRVTDEYVAEVLALRERFAQAQGPR